MVGRAKIGYAYRMESPARQIALVPPPDRRQSETALAIARGTARLLRSLGFSCISELPLPSGRRADLVALNERGEIWIVEIKSSVEDLRADQKWQEYRAHCDRLFFAFTQDLPCEIFPDDTGLIIADAYGAHLHCEAPEHRLPAPTRKLMTRAVRDGRGAADQPAGRSAGACGVLGTVVTRDRGMPQGRAKPHACSQPNADQFRRAWWAQRFAPSPTMTSQAYRGARFARIRCRVRRCMFSRRAVSETLRLHIS